MARRTLVRDVLSTPELPVHTFGFGDVLRIVDTKKWRLQNFLSGTRFRLSATGGQLGRGQGSRRLFRLQDLYRIAIADVLVKDGFSPKLVSDVLQFIEDSDLVSYGEKGLERMPAIGLFRGEDWPRVEYISDSHRVRHSGDNAPFYVLDLERITEEIAHRTKTLSKMGGE
jgi:hypothetical protein